MEAGAPSIRATLRARLRVFAVTGTAATAVRETQSAVAIGMATVVLGSEGNGSEELGVHRGDTLTRRPRFYVGRSVVRNKSLALSDGQDYFALVRVR
jgi:hypothetical protein